MRNGGAVSTPSPFHVRVTRNDVPESEHRIHVVVADPAGNVRHLGGDPDRVVFPRSAMKPFQALAVLTSGAADAFGFSDEELAVVTGSHNGEDAHVAAVRSILLKVDLPESALRCGTHAPFHAATAARLGEAFTSIHHNCSGKHAGMLALAKHLGQDPATYLNPEGLTQRAIREAIAGVAEMPATSIIVATDGCSAPAHAIPLAKAAMLYARLARPEAAPESYRNALSRIAGAMRKHPWFVAGSERFDTDLMDSAELLIAKRGAEGVEGVADLASGLGMLIKVEDGADRATAPATVEACRQMSWLDIRSFETLGDHWRPVLLNAAGKVVGGLEAAGTLEAREFSVG